MKVGDAIELPDSQLGSLYGTGRVIETWHNHAKVEFIASDGSKHIGIYTVPDTAL